MGDEPFYVSTNVKLHSESDTAVVITNCASDKSTLATVTVMLTLADVVPMVLFILMAPEASCIHLHTY